MKTFEEVKELRSKLNAILSNGKWYERKSEYNDIYFQVCKSEYFFERIVRAAVRMVDAVEAAPNDAEALRRGYDRVLYEVRNAREGEAA